MLKGVAEGLKVRAATGSRISKLHLSQHMRKDMSLVVVPPPRRLTYVNRTMPVLAMAYDRPRMPLPMMALLRLKTDMPKEAWPGCCSD